MFDQVIKFLSIVLGGLLVFLFGYLLAALGHGPSSESGPPTAIESQTEAQPTDLTTRRVKTITVRPEDEPEAPARP